MDAQEKVYDFFETNARYNFYVYDSKGDKVGASVDNETIDQAKANFDKILNRLEGGKYALKAKKTLGDDGNNGLIKVEFTVPQNSPSKTMTGYKEMLEAATREAKFQIEFEQMKEDVKVLKKFVPILESIAKNESKFLKVLQTLLDDDEENDETGQKKLEEIGETVTSIIGMLDTFKK